MAKVSVMPPISRNNVMTKIQEKIELRTIHFIFFLALSVKCRIIEVITQENCPLLWRACSFTPWFLCSHPPASVLSIHRTKLFATRSRLKHFYKQSLVPGLGLKKLIGACVHNDWILQRKVCSNKNSVQEKNAKTDVYYNHDIGALQCFPSGPCNS